MADCGLFAQPVVGLGTEPSEQYTRVLGSHCSQRTWHVSPPAGFRHSPILALDFWGQLSHMNVHHAALESVLKSVTNGPLPLLLMPFAIAAMSGCVVALQKPGGGGWA